MIDRPKVHLALIAVQVMFASLAVVAKIALRDLSPFALVALRTPSAAAILFTAYLLLGPERVAPRDLLSIAVYALFGIVLNQLLFIAGVARTSATNAVVLGAMIPVFTVAVAVALRKEAATANKILGLAVALGGALGVVGAGRFEAGHTLGNLLIVANSLSYGIYLVISRGVLERYRALTVIAWTFVFGALGVLPFGARDLAAQLPHAHASTLAALAWIVIFPSVTTYFLNAWALRRAPASTVAIYIYLQPVMGALLAAALLGERPAISTAIGALAIGAGIWIVTR